MTRLDNYEQRPAGMDKYLSVYGWHFSKAMAQFAINKLYQNTELITPEAYEKISRTHNAIKMAKGYDGYFLLAKFKAIFPTTPPIQVVDLVEQYLSTCYDTAVFGHFYADTIANELPIIWEDVL